MHFYTSTCHCQGQARSKCIICSAGRMIDCNLSSLQDLYESRILKRAKRIVASVTVFSGWRLLSIRTKTSCHKVSLVQDQRPPLSRNTNLPYYSRHVSSSWELLLYILATKKKKKNWQTPLFRATYVYLISTSEQLRVLLKSPTSAAWQHWELSSQHSSQQFDILTISY